MAGLETKTPVPTRIVVHQVSRVLEIEYGDGRSFRLPFEFLRVYSPSAEVRGHGPGQEVLQTGKAEVGIDAVEPVGNYAIQPKFSDGHATGIYSWDYLYRLGENQEKMWQDYLKRLEAAGASRYATPSVAAGTASGATASAASTSAAQTHGASAGGARAGSPSGSPPAGSPLPGGSSAGSAPAVGPTDKGPIGAKALIRPR